MGMRVYLCGPMTGSITEEVMEWRRHAKAVLKDCGFTVLDPARGLMFLKPEEVVKDAYEETTTETKHTVFLRDKFDSTRSDILIMNLTGAKRISVGSLMELAWAHLSNRFAVVVMEREGNPHMHAFVRECAGVVLEDLDEALNYIIATFRE